MSRQVLAIVATAACAVACAADGAIALFQQRAEKLTEKKRMGLPGVDSLLEKPEGVLKLVNSHVGELQKQLELIQGSNKDAVLRLRDEYSKRLFREGTENKQVETVNHRIELEIETIKTHNQNRRQHAESMSLRSQALLADARAMRENVTSADEFIKSALAIQNDSLQAPEFRVLAELRENKSSIQQGKLHASMLQIGEMATVPMETAQALDQMRGMASSLAASFDQIEHEQNESTASLQTQFERQLNELTSRHSALLVEQERLNKTRDDLRSLNQRIVVADEHLTNLTANFEERAIALREYLEAARTTGPSKGLETPIPALPARPSSLEHLPKQNDGKVVTQAAPSTRLSFEESYYQAHYSGQGKSAGRNPGKHPGKRQAMKKKSAMLQVKTSGCAVDLKTKAPSAEFNYVCDTMEGGWFHYDGEAWATASAGSGGCHTYKFVNGDLLDGCTVGNACKACENPSGEVVGLFYLNGDTCDEPSSC